MSRKTDAAALWSLPFSAMRAASKVCWSGMEAALSLGAKGAESLGEMRQRGRRKKTREARSRTRSTAEEQGESTDERMSQVLARLKIPTRREVDDLKRRIDELAERISATVAAAAGEGERRVYHVTPDEAGWKVALEGADGAVSVHPAKGEAVKAARELAHRTEPSQVVIHRQDGTIQTHHTYGDTAEGPA